MNTKAIEKEHFIQESLERVYRALTEKAELERWFVQKAEIDLKPKGAVRLEWAPGMAEHGLVRDIQPNQLISYTWEAFSPTPTTVTFMVKAEKNGTLLQLTHSGIGQDEKWGDYYKNLNKGWDIHLKDLTSWIETGTCPPPGPRG